MVKNLPAIWETWIWSMGWEDLLEKAIATHSSILAWRILWTEELGRLQSMASQRVRYDWASKLSVFSWFVYEVDFIIRILQMTKGDLERLNNLPKVKSAVSDETRIQILALCQQNLSSLELNQVKLENGFCYQYQRFFFCTYGLGQFKRKKNDLHSIIWLSIDGPKA